MPKFFLHIRDGDNLIEDPEGMDFPDLEAAKIEAQQAARDILADRVKDGQLVDGQILEIWSNKRLVAEVPFKAVLKLD